MLVSISNGIIIDNKSILSVINAVYIALNNITNNL